MSDPRETPDPATVAGRLRLPSATAAKIQTIATSMHLDFEAAVLTLVDMGIDECRYIWQGRTPEAGGYKYKVYRDPAGGMTTSILTAVADSDEPTGTAETVSAIADALADMEAAREAGALDDDGHEVTP